MSLAAWPTGPGPERERRILAAVREGDFEHDFCPLKISGGGNVLTVFVSCDAMKFDGVRMTMSARTQQLVADELGAVMLTPKLVDLIFLSATDANRLKPQFMPISSTTEAVEEHSRRVDAEIDRRGASVLPALSNVGKDWVLTKKLWTEKALAARKAANYGWLGTRRVLPTDERAVFAPGVLAVQGVGLAHDYSHSDYSQTARFVRRLAVLDGQPVDLADVYTGRAEGTDMVSHEGALPDYRQPGITVVAGSAPEGGGGAPQKSAGPVVATGLAGGIIGAVAGGGPGALIGATIGGIVGAVTR